MTYVNPTYAVISASDLFSEGWRESRNSNRDGHTVYTRVNSVGRYEIICRNNETGDVVAQASWGTDGGACRQGEKLFGDRLEAAGLPRQGY